MNQTTLKLLIGLTVVLGLFSTFLVLAAIWLLSWQTFATAAVLAVLAVVSGCVAAIVADEVL